VQCQPKSFSVSSVHRFPSPETEEIRVRCRCCVRWKELNYLKNSRFWAVIGRAKHSSRHTDTPTSPKTPTNHQKPPLTAPNLPLKNSLRHFQVESEWARAKCGKGDVLLRLENISVRRSDGARRKSREILMINSNKYRDKNNKIAQQFTLQLLSVVIWDMNVRGGIAGSAMSWIVQEGE
jgi:hypothetical protein